MYDKVKYLPAGDSALTMEFGNEISVQINKRIRNTVTAIENNPPEGLRELIPTYRSIQVIYDPMLSDFEKMVQGLEEVMGSVGEGGEDNYRIVEIPTCYGGDYGADIEFVAKHNDLTVEEVIRIHSSTDYLLYMLGFTPGFGYLGGMSEKIATPRLEVPRTIIPAGSVGIAASQTGIYPIDSPGGWQLIGRTPIKLYDPLAEVPVLLNAGDYVRFKPISEDKYKEIQRLINENKYEVNIIHNGEVRLDVL
ncbi:5-oxoprolinase subunit PxpB [Gudongella sp. SC589]|jgi:KipI family sensor histidine kinase inhibitor|uniref:5-oxoprolinase subunit PxpB n=1 Tax=Gudongella sp. SC589 TaxID=3385990 RepID=UPI003904877C